MPKTKPAAAAQPAGPVIHELQVSHAQLQVIVEALGRITGDAVAHITPDLDQAEDLSDFVSDLTAMLLHVLESKELSTVHCLHL